MSIDEIVKNTVQQEVHKLRKELLLEIHGHRLLKEKEACKEFNISISLIQKLRKQGIVKPSSNNPIRYNYKHLHTALCLFFKSK